VTHTLSCSDFLARLDGLGLFHMDLTLDRMAAFVARHGQPRFPVLHVVGTNGKGSTATILAELLTAHGLRVGLSVSPHFVSVRERILVAWAMLSEDTWARLGARVFEEADGLGLTYFEVLTVLALLAFEDAGVDVAVMEAGLGGRFDATNVLNPALTVFTPIGMDHMNVLGGTLEEIAMDKAGAMRSAGLAVSAPQEPAAWRVLRDTAREIGSEFIAAAEVLYYSRANGRVQPGPLASRGKKRFVRPMTGLWLALPGLHQELNARTALAAFHVWADSLRLPVNEDACRQAFARAFIPGRMQLVNEAPGLPRQLILDGGHNAHGLAALGAALEAEDLRPAAVVFGCLRDKPLSDMLPLVRGIAGEAPLYAVGIPSCPRACAPEELAGLLGPDAVPKADIHAALEHLRHVPGPVLVCGSLYLLGEFYTQHPRLLERDQSPSAPRRS
jgi:dihydrofolate synthase/folylpolyglutamate synthase